MIDYNSADIYKNRYGLSSSSNIDDIITPGSYRMSAMNSSNNSPVTNGMLLVFRQSGTTVQLCLSSTASDIYIRIYWTTKWFDWVKI